MAPDPDESNILDKKATKRIHSIVGTMIYYARSVYPTMLKAIKFFSQLQSRPTRDTEEKARMSLDYATMYPNEILSYKSSDMVLHVDSDATYLTMPEARSCYADRFYLSDWTSLSPIKPNQERNAPIHTECKTIRNIVSSTTEVETYGIFNNGKTAIGMRQELITLDHKQPSTPLKTDNYTTKTLVTRG